ncbi:MAG: FG-GAP repeat protein, partial [Blastocatellia bacterium]
DYFGSSVAISGETVVVGAWGEDSSATGGQSDNSALYAGAAYVFNTPPITIGIVEPPVTAAPIGPGSTTTITQTLTNNTPVPITGTFVATLPNGLSAIGCTSPFGSCGVTTTTSGGALNGTNRSSSINNSQANQTVTWTGTIPANGSVTITYQVQVGVQVTSGSQYCITSMIGTTPGPTTCIRVNTPASGPGNMPIAARLPNPQKPGSLLIFNVYTSSVNTTLSDTQISLTNTNPVSPANVHLFFVDGSSCSVADQIVTLTQNQTVTFRASDVDPGVTGYLIAVAVDQSGCPVVGNYLIGVEDVRFESGHHATLPAIGVSGLGVGATPCLSNSVTTTLAFNGVQYDELPRGLGIASLPSLATGNSPMLIINRIGGDLTSGAERMGALAGLMFDDGETSRSFTLTGGLCQMRGMLGNNLPRTVPRYGTVIPAERTGWMKFWAAGDEALSGVMINAGTSGFSGGYNLQTLTTTNSASLIIPVIPVR